MAFLVKYKEVKKLGNKSEKKPASEIVKSDSPKNKHKKALDYLIFQIYSQSKFIYERHGIDVLREFYHENKQHYFDLNMSFAMKAFDSVIKKIPKSLRIKEGLKYFINELQFMEDPSNILIHEQDSDHAVFEITKCTIRKKFNKLAKKDKNEELIDACCLWCKESMLFFEDYGLKFRIELTDKGCMNYLE
ncbi:MAG: hypothetical protein ACXQS8_05335 [Candidatus Helarchaeales archaeon]